MATSRYQCRCDTIRPTDCNHPTCIQEIRSSASGCRAMLSHISKLIDDGPDKVSSKFLSNVTVLFEGLKLNLEKPK